MQDGQWGHGEFENGSALDARNFSTNVSMKASTNISTKPSSAKPSSAKPSTRAMVMAEKALEKWSAAAELGDVEANFNMGWAQQVGWGAVRSASTTSTQSTNRDAVGGTLAGEDDVHADSGANLTKAIEYFEKVVLLSGDDRSATAGGSRIAGTFALAAARACQMQGVLLEMALSGEYLPPVGGGDAEWMRNAWNGLVPWCQVSS